MSNNWHYLRDVISWPIETMIILKSPKNRVVVNCGRVIVIILLIVTFGLGAIR